MFPYYFWHIILTIFAAIIFSRTLFWIFRKKCLRLPPGPRGLPIVGYLPFLGKEPFRVLNELGKKYGNVFSLYLGQTYVVILNDFAAVKDAFSQSATIDRPPKLFDFIPGGVGFSSINGKAWAEQRKYSVRSMTNLGLGKGPWETILLEEIEEFLKIVKGYKEEPVDIASDLFSSVSNNMTSFVLDKRFPIGSSSRNFLNYSIDKSSQFFAQTGARNYFPLLSDILTKLGFGGLDKWHDDLVAFNNYLIKEIDDCKNSSDCNDEAFIKGYLQEMKSRVKDDPESSYNLTNLCGNVKALIIGGSETTKTSLVWLVLAMASYPDVQKKVFQELVSVLGPSKVATWHDRLQLPYTYATIMEGQRWRTIAPLNTSRIAQEHIKICGYDIPKGSTIIANNWGLHHDTRYWKNPESFMPEHFLTDNGKEAIQKPESYVAFSLGKRNCPGETVAMMELLVYFSGLVKNFEIKFPGYTTEPKLEARLGLTYQPVGQKLCFIARHQ